MRKAAIGIKIFEVRRKLSSKSIPDLKLLPIITPVNSNKFIKKAREYILNIIKTSSMVKIQNEIILLNNGADICDPLTSSQYYYNPKIHNFGNIGISGKIHAELALIATKTIDIIRYDGRNIREEITED